MRRLMDKVMLHCRKATFLIEKGNDDPLTVVEKMQLNMHLSMCDGCRTYRKQNRFLERLLKRHAHATLISKEYTAELESRIIDNLERNTQ